MQSSASSSSSSSDPKHSWGENSHDLFISFRGEDTRHGFVNHLRSALGRHDIRIYVDDRDLERGNEISSTLLRAIEQSKISLVVFTKTYASSKWTLDELEKIMKCKRTGGQLVLPIFYGISPSEVRKRRSYSTLFRNHNNLSRAIMNETAQRWAIAMREAADLAGWESSTYRTEVELAEVIAAEVKRQLESTIPAAQGHDQAHQPEPSSLDSSRSSVHRQLMTMSSQTLQEPLFTQASALFTQGSATLAESLARSSMHNNSFAYLLQIHPETLHYIAFTATISNCSS